MCRYEPVRRTGTKALLMLYNFHINHIGLHTHIRTKLNVDPTVYYIIYIDINVRNIDYGKPKNGKIKPENYNNQAEKLAENQRAMSFKVC